MPKSEMIQQMRIGRRSIIASAAIMSGLLATGCHRQPQAVRPRILFVCQAGTVKSAIAREIFKRRAVERGMNVDVLSRGIAVEDHVSAELRQKLLADGINTTAEPAMQLSQADLGAVDILVYFNPLPAHFAHKDMREWSDVPSINDDYSVSRAMITQRIDALLTEIAANKEG